MNKHWIEQNGFYDLHFEPYYDDEIILRFFQDDEDSTCFWYVSNMLNVEDDCIYAESIEDEIEDFEYKVKEYFQDQINYYDELLEKFEESE